MLGLLVQNQSHRAGTHLRGKLLRRIAHQTFFSGEMVSANPGAVQIPTATAAEEELARLLFSGCDVTVDCLSGLLRHLEPDRPTGLLLAHSCPIDRLGRSNLRRWPRWHGLKRREADFWVDWASAVAGN